MFKINDLIDLQALSESSELEFKLAQGADGKGKLPDDFWRSYSAMANSRGGYVVLGVREKKGRFYVEGIEDFNTVKKQIFDISNNKKKVNVNLIVEECVQCVSIDSKTVSYTHLTLPTTERV